MSSDKPVELSFCRSICIDFDGTIVDEEFPKIGKLKDGAKEFINELAQKYSVLCLTNRVSPAVFSMDDVGTQQYLLDKWKKENDIHIDAFVAYKPRAIIFIDDKALRFDDAQMNWGKIKEVFLANGLI